MRKPFPIKKSRLNSGLLGTKSYQEQKQDAKEINMQQHQQAHQATCAKNLDKKSEPKNIQIHTDVARNKTYLTELFSKCSDIILHEIQIINGPNMLLLKVDGLADTSHFDDNVLKSLMLSPGVAAQMDQQPPYTAEELMMRFIPMGQSKIMKTMSEAIDHVLTGDTVVFFNGYDQAIAISAKKWEHRAPEEPSTEAVVRGPREGFVESIRTNTALLRRRIRTVDFKIESLKVGRVTKTDVALAYIEGIVTDSVVDELRTRLERIDIDGVIDSGYIVEFIEDQPLSPFPQIQSTERPDTVTACLLEGRCVILIDGSPFTLIAPVNIWGSLQANEDYYQRFLAATIIRWIRYIFTLMALLLPSMYIAITTFHQEMLPTNLLLSLAAAREASPFPALVEAFIMEITFEALREAGVRLPKAVGQAVSIVGALVIGQAAVQAGIVSSPMVIIVSVTGIANFTIPRYEFALGIRILRFPLMILAGTFGLYGIVIGLIAIIGHICALRSVGVPYAAPLAPFSIKGLKDTLLRAPWYSMNWRPRLFGYQNSVRVPKGQKPRPPQQNVPKRRGGS
ncbi:spore germination protein [Fodinisporobacter ferrooxydans]|uniref:Spore germination protein n=1 Tax=Fodinisporobacter ferrooxydans TaxID=2901836 RepID=A0ABY4CJG5_9BACL|nr:spore germination protein [Alicyclobacillaceae bacterium MYW30-H2]